MLTSGGITDDGRDDDGEQEEDDQDHDLDVGPGDGLHAAEHRVDHGGHRDEQRGRGQVQVEHERQHDGRRGDDRAARHAAREQEQQAGEAAGLRVEPFLEVLVRRVDARVVEERDQRHRQDDHRQRQAEVELHEAHAVVVALTGRADHRDGAELRGHHRDARRPPGNAALGEQVAVELVAVFGSPQAVVNDPDEEDAEQGPVNPVQGGRVDVAQGGRGSQAACRRWSRSRNWPACPPASP